MMKTERSKSVRMLPESVSGLIGISTVYAVRNHNRREKTKSSSVFVDLGYQIKIFVKRIPA